MQFRRPEPTLFPPEPVNHLLLLDKPIGPTSAGALNQLKHLLPRGIKVGHAGTLDPFASGLLVVLLGKATKQCEAMMGQAKRYDATLKLGATSESLDPETPEQSVAGNVPSEAHVRDVISQFIGVIQQTPPAYSAIKLGGKRAVDRLRAGEIVTLQPRSIRIDSIELLEFSYPLLRLDIRCGRGTYVRSLACDIGIALGSAAYLVALRRTAIGAFAVQSAQTLEQLQRGEARWITPHGAV